MIRFSKVKAWIPDVPIHSTVFRNRLFSDHGKNYQPFVVCEISPSNFHDRLLGPNFHVCTSYQCYFLLLPPPCLFQYPLCIFMTIFCICAVAILIVLFTIGSKHNLAYRFCCKSPFSPRFLSALQLAIYFSLHVSFYTMSIFMVGVTPW